MQRMIRRAAQRIGLLALALALVAIIGEIAVRVAVSRMEPLHTEAPSPDPHPGLPVLEGIAQLNRPHVRGVYHGTLYATNSRGVRGPEYAPSPPAGTFRIVAAGDSITMGSGVEEEETYAARVEKMLDRSARSGVHFEVVNLGLAGANIGQTVLRLERLGLPYGPHLIVYGFTVNDIEGSEYRDVSEGDLRAWRDELERFAGSPSYLLRFAWPQWVSLRSALSPLPGSYEHTLQQNYFENPAAWARFTDGLDDLVQIGRGSDACVLVLMHTVIAELRGIHPYRGIYDRVAAAARLRGLPVQTTFERFRGRAPGPLQVGPFDRHPNAAAHAILAEALFDGLTALPARCGPDPIGRGDRPAGSGG